jgi:replicative DNA helicase
VNALPPHSAEAERAVLGSMLRDNATIADVVQLVGANAFHTDAHQKLFRAMLDLWEAHKPVDLVTLAEQLKALKQIEDVGGYPYLGELLDAAPTAANAEHYARIVRDKAINRNLIHAATEIQRNAQDQVAPVEELLGEAERKILSIGELVVSDQESDIVPLIFDAYERYDRRKNCGDNYASARFGFYDLDALTGGFHAGELSILAARPSVGKTSLGVCIARHVVLNERIPVFFVSLEQGKDDLTDRVLCSESGVSSHRLRCGLLDQAGAEAFRAAGRKFAKEMFFLDDIPNQTILRIVAKARRLRLRKGIGLVIIDYLQLIEPENPKVPRYQQVGEISRRLKNLARELKIPVMAMSALNRAPEGTNRKPRLSDLRESGNIESDADTVLLLYRLDGDDDDKEHKRGAKRPEVAPIGIIIAKQRNGPTREISLGFREACMRFENLVPDATVVDRLWESGLRDASHAGP